MFFFLFNFFLLFVKLKNSVLNTKLFLLKRWEQDLILNKKKTLKDMDL
jgi:hypothetical protein